MRDCDFSEDVETGYMIAGGRYGRHPKCPNCHLVYVNPVEKAGKIKGAYLQRMTADAYIIQETRLTAAKS
jgi:hypothetical protein